jgi:hypothetical protein
MKILNHSSKKNHLARSEYFARMFDSDFKESKDKIVQIQEEDEKLFKQMIKLIYTNEISELSYDIAMDLIILAQKYNFTNLIESCSKVILASLNVETCLDILAVAESAQSEELMEEVFTFCFENIKAVIGSQKFTELKTENPVLALELTTKAIETNVK